MGRHGMANERGSAADDARLEADEQFRVLFERAPIGMGLVAPNGRWILASVSSTHDRHGSPLFIAHLVDISDRKRLEARLRFLADHDPLTGLRNRRAFAQDLLVQLGRCQRYGEEAALLMLDLDGFKAMNDRHGHTAGDDVLKAVANTLMGQVRSSDIVARLGGDEFAVLLAHVTPEHATAVAEHVRAAIAAIAVPVGTATLRPAVSIGVAPITETTRSDEEVLATADSAMYRAKRAAVPESGDGAEG
jgi:diguanylate cyclase (GGDEF)-like protein